MHSFVSPVIHVRLAPENITDINRIMEGYEHLALVSTIDSKAGIVKLSATSDTLEDVLAILKNLPFDAEIIEC